MKRRSYLMGMRRKTILVVTFIVSLVFSASLSFADTGSGGEGGNSDVPVVIDSDLVLPKAGGSALHRVSPQAASVRIIRISSNTHMVHLSLPVGDTTDDVGADYTDAAPSTATWSSSDNSLFTVSGTTTRAAITAGSSEGNGTLTLSVRTTASEDIGETSNISIYTPISGSIRGKTSASTEIWRGASTSSVSRGVVGSGEDFTVTGKCGAYYWVVFDDHSIFSDYPAQDSGYGYVRRSDVSIPATGVDVSPAYADMGISNTAQFSEDVSPSIATDKTVTWTSGNTGVATVNSSGRATGRKEGVSVIRATANTGSGAGTAKATVYTRISLSGKTNKSIAAWHSGDGTATAGNLAQGTAVTISGQCGNYWRVNTNVYVLKSAVDISVTGISINKTSASMVAGDTLTLKATVAPSAATDKKITWKSSNTNIATVNSAGKVTAKAAGAVRITAVSSNPLKTASCLISVKLKAPAISQIVSGGDKKATISWGKIPNATGYSIYRATSSNGTYTRVANVGAVTSYTNPAPGYAEYWYKVSANYSAGSQYGSAQSAAKKFNTLLPPRFVSAMPNKKTKQAVLKWNKAPGATSYTVYRAYGSASAKYSAVTTTSNLTFKDKKGTNSAKYFYKIKSVRKITSKKNLISDFYSNTLYVGQDTNAKVKRIALINPRSNSNSCRIVYGNTKYLTVKVYPENAYNKNIKVSVIQPKNDFGEEIEVIRASYNQIKGIITVSAVGLSFWADDKPATIVVQSTDGGGAKTSYKVWVDDEED
jgi:uncharacterized protein YjdB